MNQIHSTTSNKGKKKYKNVTFLSAFLRGMVFLQILENKEVEKFQVKMQQNLLIPRIKVLSEQKYIESHGTPKFNIA